MVEEGKEQREGEGSFSMYYYSVATEAHRFHFTLVLHYARMGRRITGPGLKTLIQFLSQLQRSSVCTFQTAKTERRIQ